MEDFDNINLIMKLCDVGGPNQNLPRDSKSNKLEE
jgi:hypothetical protein